ncbi:hypothetical protein EUTSA_v10026257mg, partial [Eutrema salsugineum]
MIERNQLELTGTKLLNRKIRGVDDEMNDLIGDSEASKLVEHPYNDGDSDLVLP